MAICVNFQSILWVRWRNAYGGKWNVKLPTYLGWVSKTAPVRLRLMKPLAELATNMQNIATNRRCTIYMFHMLQTSHVIIIFSYTQPHVNTHKQTKTEITVCEVLHWVWTWTASPSALTCSARNTKVLHICASTMRRLLPIWFLHDYE